MARRLPLGIQGFEKIRKEGYVYVDKTDLAWQIANGNTYNFLSRPRRFGKSLLTSTLKCYFEGRKDLFEGLKIMELEKEWTKRPVFLFDFSGLETANALSDYISGMLDIYEKEYGKGSFTNLNSRFAYLIEKAYEKTGQQVAVLVDEYDAPLQHTLFKKDEHEAIVTVYRSFFPALKTAGDYLKCLFLTGITKFTQLSLFSTLNNISIIGHRPQYATVCGVTQQEILDNFQPELEAMGKANGWTVDETLDKLKNMYDGYRFSSDADPEKMVYNPFSLINALSDKDLNPYWASSGGSSLLNELLQQADTDKIDVENCYIDKDDLEMDDVSLENVELFLYQSGYLTIKDYDGDSYTLGIPNNEVRRALYKIVLPNTLQKRSKDVDNSIRRIREALKKDDIDTMMKNLQQFLAETPYSRDSDNYKYEEYYRMIMRAVFCLVGCRVQEEKHVATGGIDFVARYGNKTTLVFELKMNSNGGIEAAKKQFIDKNYTSAYSAEPGKVYAIAVSFDEEKRGIDTYEILN